MNEKQPRTRAQLAAMVMRELHASPGGNAIHDIGINKLGRVHTGDRNWQFGNGNIPCASTLDRMYAYGQTLMAAYYLTEEKPC